MNYITIKKSAYHEEGDIVEVSPAAEKSSYLSVYKSGELMMLVHEDGISEYYIPLYKYREETIDNILKDG
jgi:Cys-tRNA synthase (O-phospho-L-seryl-tRNA:Cys-tRNA synthase)